MRINNNIMAMNTHRQLGSANTAGSKSMEKLSSGLRINRAGDDAAGLSISEKMRGQIRGLNQASRNAQDGISMIQTAEGALNESHSILQRMRELATQSATDTNTAADRKEIQEEVSQLASELTRISNNTEFNTQNLVGGNMDVKFHVGANEGQNIGLKVAAMDAFTLGVAGTSVSATVDGSGDVTAATASGSAAAVVDGNEITATTTAVLATAATITGTTTPAAAGAGDAGDLVFSVDGTTYTAAVADTDTLATIIGSINTAAGSVVASDVGGALVLTSGTTGESSSITIDASSTAATLTHLGLTASDSDTGSDASFTLTLSDTAGSTNSVITGLAANATTASGTGDFAGIELTLDGALANAEASVITLAVESGSAATFNADGTINEEAVAAAGIDVSTQTAANTAITTINKAIETVSSERSKLGAMQNRLEHTISNLGTSAENLQAAESRVRDVDMAAEMMQFTKNNILQQASTAMLAQANQAPQSVLQLLG